MAIRIYNIVNCNYKNKNLENYVLHLNFPGIYRREFLFLSTRRFRLKLCLALRLSVSFTGLKNRYLRNRIIRKIFQHFSSSITNLFCFSEPPLLKSTYIREPTAAAPAQEKNGV